MRLAAAVMSLLVAVLVAAAMARPAAAAPRVAFGAYHPGAPGSRSAMDELTQLAGRRPVVWLTYRMWGETPVPHDMMRTVDAAGGVASVTWHPENAGLRAIAGGRHDAYIKSSARDAASWGKPVFIRFGAEMNGGWFPWGLGVNGNTAGDFIAAWRHVVRLFRDAGANNVRWVWSPNVGRFDSLYPGDAWVDWLALDGYNWGAKHGNWESFDEIYADSYRAITRLSRKPLMIGEFASAEAGGNKAAWVRQTFSRENLERYSRIKLYIWFDVNKETDWRINSSGATLSAFRSAIGSSMFDLSLSELLALGDSDDPAPSDPAPPADPKAPADPGDAIAGAVRLRCSLRPPRSIRVTRAWDATVPLRCGSRPAVRCDGVVTLKDARSGRTLGRARVELWARRARAVRVGLPGWAQTSLRAAMRLSVRASLSTRSGCRGGTRRVTLAR